jgi:hypothetical protein
MVGWWVLLVVSCLAALIGVIIFFAGISDDESAGVIGGGLVTLFSGIFLYLSLANLFFTGWPLGPKYNGGAASAVTSAVASATPTPTPTPQFCLGSFAETASVKIGTANPESQVLQVQGPCIALRSLKSGSTATIPVRASGPSAQVTLQSYTNDFSIVLSTPDSITLKNCSGSSTISETGSVTKTLQSGVAMGDTFYSSAPLAGDTLDLLVEAVFVQDATTIATVTSGTNIYTVTATPHTQVTRFITWQEHFVAGQASVAVSQSTPLVTSVYAIPTGIQFSGFQDVSAKC